MARTGRPKTSIDVEKICEHCGESFQVRSWEEKKAQPKKFCSRSCYQMSRRGQSDPRRQMKPIEKVCEQCGTIFLAGGRGRPKRHQRFCSANCAHGSMVEQPKPSQMSEGHAGQIGGLIDGEGNIALVPGLRVSIHNTNEPLIRHVEAITGTGSIGVTRRGKEGYKDLWVWRCYGANARDILRQSLPYIVAKHELTLEVLNKE